MRLLVLDGNSILNRAFYGIKLLTTKNGEYTNAVYGFMTMMLKILSDTSPDAVAVAFDMKAPTFRHKEYEGYKANRHGMPEELASQLPIVKELLMALGYKLVECEGFEADDILGTLAGECEKSGNSCILATGDRDSLQLVSKDVSVRLITTKNVVTYNESKIMEDYGVVPKQLIDIKALQGDTSDNIPGVKGIGQKGASDLIIKFGSIDYIYQNLDSLDLKPAMRKKLTEGRESAYLSRFLGEISKNAPIDKNINSYIPEKSEREKALRIMTRLELFSLIKKLGLDEAVIDTSEKISDSDVTIPEKIFRGKVSADGIGNIVKNSDTVYVIKTDEFVCFCADDSVYISEDTDKALCVIFGSDCKKVTHCVKPVFSVLDKLGSDDKGCIIDTELMAYLLNPSAASYDTERLMSEYCGKSINQAVKVDFSESAKTDETVKELVIRTAALEEISHTLENKIKENNQENLLLNIEVPLAKVLASMENTGFMADKEGISEFGNTLGLRIKDIEQRIYTLVGEEFNINSPKQLGTALFEKLQLPPLKKTKSGYSTNAEVLEKLIDEHPVIELIMEYRQLAKLKSTYCDGLLKVIGEDGRIHSSFNQTETRTGRISSTEPNLQNIPVRTELGKEMRRFFIAKKGCVLEDADYSQIELRVLAHIADDTEMCRAFRNNDDIHAITAAQVFGKGIPLEMVTPVMRSRAKAVNFGIVYGIGAFSLSKDIGVTVREAKKYISDYLTHYNGVDKYMNDVISDAKDKGYVETMFSRRRYLPELSSSNKNIRAFGERVARNMPVQGTAADIIKIAMIRVYNRLKAEKLKAKLILQVHDELIVEAPENEKETVKQILQYEMENAAKLKVPLVADANYGTTWYDAKG